MPQTKQSAVPSTVGYVGATVGLLHNVDRVILLNVRAQDVGTASDQWAVVRQRAERNPDSNQKFLNPSLLKQYHQHSQLELRTNISTSAPPNLEQSPMDPDPCPSLVYTHCGHGSQGSVQFPSSGLTADTARTVRFMRTDTHM